MVANAKLQNSADKTALDIVVDYLLSSKSAREEFIGANGNAYAMGTAVFNATKGAFSRYGKGEGDVRIAHTDSGMIGAYVDKDGKLIATMSAVQRGHYNVVQARVAKFIAGIAESLPYGMIFKRVKVQAKEIPQKLSSFIKDNHKYSKVGGVLPRTFVREWENLRMSIQNFKDAEFLEEGTLAYDNLKAVTKILLNCAVKQENEGQKTVVKQSELTEPVVAGAELFVLKIVQEEADVSAYEE